MLNLLRLDLLNRLKSQRFWLACLWMVAITLFLFPNAKAGYAVIDISGFRGIYNSAWMGETLALVSSWLLLLFGFYFVVGTIDQERRNHVLAMLLSSKLTVTRYLLLKFLTHLVQLLLIGLSMLSAALSHQVLVAEPSNLDLIAYLVPFLVLSLPVYVLVSALAILFEVVPRLAGKARNLYYFGVWSLLSVANMAGFSAHTAITAQMESAVGSSAGLLSGTISIGFSPLATPQQLFVWQGTAYGNDVLLPVFSQCIVALLVLMLALWLANGRYHILYQSNLFSQDSKDAKQGWMSAAKAKLVRLPNRLCTAFPLLISELNYLILRVTGKGLVAMIGVSVLALVLPVNVIKNALLPVTAILPLFLMSAMANRDQLSGLEPLLLAHRSVQTLMSTRWVAAVVFLVIVYSGLLLRFAVEQDVTALLHLFAYICLVPLLALSLSAAFSSNKPFELILILSWIAGCLNKEVAFDFIGSTGQSSAMQMTWLWLGIGVLFMITYGQLKASHAFKSKLSARLFIRDTV